jgi:hypothetical protein
MKHINGERLAAKVSDSLTQDFNENHDEAGGLLPVHLMRVGKHVRRPRAQTHPKR